MIEGLNQAVYDILGIVESITGKGFDFIEKPDLEPYASVSIARSHMPKHIIVYKNIHMEIISHLIAHECGHILRLFRAPADKRVVVGTTDKTKHTALSEMETDIIRLNDKYGFDKTATVINMWYAGIVRQLTNEPPDIMIERWLYNEYPALRDCQLKAYEKQFNDAIQGIQTGVKDITPAKIYEASNLMNYAFYRILGMMMGVNFVRKYSNTINLEKGKALAAIIENSKIDSFENDVDLINKWANKLALSEWFEWLPFEKHT